MIWIVMLFVLVLVVACAIWANEISTRWEVKAGAMLKLLAQPDDRWDWKAWREYVEAGTAGWIKSVEQKREADFADWERRFKETNDAFEASHAEVMAALLAPPKREELPPLPACLCGSVDLLLLNGYQRVRVVACQRCGKVFGVDAAGVRFDRSPEALPQYMTQRAMAEYARAEMEAAAERMKPRPGPPNRGRGREIIERPIT